MPVNISSVSTPQRSKGLKSRGCLKEERELDRNRANSQFLPGGQKEQGNKRPEDLVT